MLQTEETLEKLCLRALIDLTQTRTLKVTSLTCTLVMASVILQLMFTMQSNLEKENINIL